MAAGLPLQFSGDRSFGHEYTWSPGRDSNVNSCGFIASRAPKFSGSIGPLAGASSPLKDARGDKVPSATPPWRQKARRISRLACVFWHQWDAESCTLSLVCLNRPGFPGDSHTCEGGGKGSMRFSAKLRERAVPTDPACQGACREEPLYDENSVASYIGFAEDL